MPIHTKSMREGLVLFGTALPLIGIGVTVLLVCLTQGVTRWIVLTGLPALTLLFCWLVIEPIWRDGNLLAAAIYMSYFVATSVYYPILAAVGVVAYRRASR